MLKYDQLKDNERRLLGLTSLKQAEFEYLLAHFAPICEGYFRYHTYEGKKRKLPAFAPHKDEKLPASRERLDGYIQAMTKSRLKYDPALVLNSDLSKESVSAATESLLTGKRKPTAIVTFNDYVAMYAVKKATTMKLKVNKDICFVSYANLPISNYTAYPPLASVEQFPYQQGQKATETLIELLKNKSKVETEVINTTYYKIILESQLVIHDGKEI